MSEENQTQLVEVKQEKQRGDRGEVGTSSPGQRLKALWRAEGGRSSLKQFIKSLKDNADVKSWRDNKSGKNNQKRTDTNIALAKTCASATKTQKRKKKGEGGAK